MDNLILLGTENVRTTIPSSERKLHTLVLTMVDYASCIEDSNYSAGLGGGLSLAVATYNNRFILPVIEEPLAEASNEVLCWQGHLFDLKSYEDKLILSHSTTVYVEPTSDLKETVLFGQPLALSENNIIIATQKTGTVQEEREFVLGGMPLLARRIGTSWYLVVG